MVSPKLHKMRSVVQRTGFTPAVLRAWEKRHGLLSPQRGPGGHRLYTQDDLTVLVQVRRLLGRGCSIGEMALLGREALLRGAEKTAPAPQQPRPETPGAPRLLEEIQDRVVQAALNLDAESLEHELDEAFSRVAPERVIHEVIELSAKRLGLLWMQGRSSVASEHLATTIFVHRLRKLLDAAARRAHDAPLVVFSCFPDETHQLGLLILAYHFTRRGAKPCYLGPALPFEDLEGACDQVSPRAVMLSVTRPAIYTTHRPRLIELLRRRATSISIFVGGQGAPQDDMEVSEAGAQLAAEEGPDAHRLEALVNLVFRSR